MDQITVLLARAGCFVEVFDLNPRGRIFYPTLTKALVERYQFAIFPQKFEDYDEAKGIKFAAGFDGTNTIQTLTIYTHGIVLEARDSTSISKRILEDALLWAARELGIAYTGPETIRSWMFYSQLTFNSSVIHRGLTSPALERLRENVNRSVNRQTGEQLDFQLSSFLLNHDQMIRKNPYGSFSIQRRENIPFSENKYYSDAPLETETHITLLEQFESDCLAAGPHSI